MEAKTGSKLRRSGRKTRTANPMAVYDYALRCAIRACLEQQSGTLTSSPSATSQAKPTRPDRHSIHMGVSGVLGSLTDKFGDEAKSDKLTREIVRGLLKRLDDVKRTSTDRTYLSVLAVFTKNNLQSQRYKPTGSVNDLVIAFLKTSESELRKVDPNPAVWYEQLNQYIARFAELVIQTIQEDAPSCATPELMEKLNNFIDPPNKSSARRRESERKQPPGSPGSPMPQNDPLDLLENFPMVKTVQNLFQVSNADHRRKLQELKPICTESVSSPSPVHSPCVWLTRASSSLGLPSGFEEMYQQYPYQPVVSWATGGFPEPAGL